MKNTMTLKGLKQACSDTKEAQPYRCWVSIYVEKTTGEIVTTTDFDSNTTHDFHDANIIFVIRTTSQMSMAGIKLTVERKLLDVAAEARTWEHIEAVKEENKMERICGQLPWELRTIEPEDKKYMVDEDRCFMEQGDYVGIGDPHATFYDTIDAAEAEYKRLVTRPMDKRDRPVIVTLSQYVAEFDTWDCIKYEVVI